MGNGALPHGPSYRAHPRLYQGGREPNFRFGQEHRTFLSVNKLHCLTRSRPSEPELVIEAAHATRERRLDASAASQPCA
jgi:hypothetical protein